LTDVEGALQRNEGYSDRRMHEVGNETARYGDFSSRSAHRPTQVSATANRLFGLPVRRLLI